ncbi:MAG: hexapeptide transferase [Acidobacteriaceae bacterium]|nr:hexapeptide transferase [Acidobacteriaceae bacterium]
MSVESANGNELTLRQVAATFGLRETREDPAWEGDFSAWLKSSRTREQLVEMFGQFRSGESVFDSLMRRVIMRSLCKSVGSDLQVASSVVLKHPETIEFGDSVFIGSQTMIQGRFDGSCRIGNHVWIGPQAYFDARDLVLEDYVGWGPGAKVLGSTHTGEPRSMPIITTELVIKPVHIGFGADIGMNASILPGVKIGAHSIVGTGSVVTRDVPDYAIVAGTPAKILRFRTDEEKPRV